MNSFVKTKKKNQKKKHDKLLFIIFNSVRVSFHLMALDTVPNPFSSQPNRTEQKAMRIQFIFVVFGEQSSDCQ